MCLDDAHEIRPPKSRSYDAWHEAETAKRLAAQYPREQSAPDKDEEIRDYRDVRGV